MSDPLAIPTTPCKLPLGEWSSLRTHPAPSSGNESEFAGKDYHTVANISQSGVKTKKKQKKPKLEAFFFLFPLTFLFSCVRKNADLEPRTHIKTHPQTYDGSTSRHRKHYPLRPRTVKNSLPGTLNLFWNDLSAENI